MLLKMPLAILLLFVCAPLGYFLGLSLLRVFPPPKEMSQYAHVLAACIALVGLLGAAVIKRMVENERESPGDSEQTRGSERPGGPVFSDQEAEHFKRIATKLWNRKEQYKQHAINLDVQHGRARDDAIHFRTRTFVWRAAFVMAFSYFLCSQVSSLVMSLVYPNGTKGLDVPWYLNYLNFLLLMIATAAVTIQIYRKYERGMSRASLDAAFRIGPGAAFLGGLIFLLHLTPEMIALINKGSVSQDPGGEPVVTLLPPVPFIPVPVEMFVPLLVYVMIQKLVLLPLISLLSVVGYLFLRRRS